MDEITKNIFDKFSEGLVQTLNPTNTLVTTTFNVEEELGEGSPNHSFPNLFSSVPSSETLFFLDIEQTKNSYDLILGILPIGYRTKEISGIQFETNRSNWEIILYLSQKLSNDGIGIFLIEPMGFSGSQGQKLLQRLNNEGLFVNGYINPPETTFRLITPIRPIFVLISKNQTNPKYLELQTNNDIDFVVSEISNLDNSDKTENLSVSEFRGFDNLKIEHQIENLETRYDTYKKTKFGDLYTELRMGKKGIPFTHSPNSFYIQNVGYRTKVSTTQDEFSGKEHLYIQLEISKSVNPEYLNVFFKSELGKLILQTTTSGMTIPRLDRKVLETIYVPLPDLTVQNQIVDTFNQFEKLQSKIEKIQDEISVNPENTELRSQIDSLLEITNSLSEGDKIRSLILQGESKKLEFKETFQYCVHQKKRTDQVEDSSLKTIVGFLNSDGGTLLIGVHDNGTITGINEEISKLHKNSNDKYLLHFTEKLKSRIGLEFLDYIDYQIIDIQGKSVLNVYCSPSQKGVFLDNTDFYVRYNPRTEKLVGQDLITYTQNRFSVKIKHGTFI